MYVIILCSVWRIFLVEGNCLLYVVLGAFMSLKRFSFFKQCVCCCCGICKLCPLKGKFLCWSLKTNFSFFSNKSNVNGVLMAELTKNGRCYMIMCLWRALLPWCIN